MTAPSGRVPWRLVVGVVAYAAWAPPALVGLPFAALMSASRPHTAREWGPTLVVGAVSLGLLLQPAGDMLTALVRAYIVLVTAAFVAAALLGRLPASFLRRAVRASLLAGVAVVALARIAWGQNLGDALHWEATRQASWSMRFLVELRPEVYALFEPVVRFVSDTVPATLLLQTLAGLALAWQWHARLARRPLGPPLAPFREFRFGDHWVWAVVAALAVWVTPFFAGLNTAALNLAVVLGVLYFVRGLAIAAVFAGALGVSVGALVLGAAAAALLAVPLLFLIPGLATLGVTDTWLEFRRRLKRRPNAT